jgi:hypothetical protein
MFHNQIIKKILDYDSENSLAFRLRKRRAGKIVGLIDECFEKYGRVNVIDVGGRKNYWKIIPEGFLKEKNVRITIVNMPSSSPLPDDDETFSFRIGDGCNLTDIANGSFHIAHSNSVIEHVGNRENMMRFAREFRRVAERYYLQTPNYWFPVEPHFVTPLFHWLPRFMRIKLVQHFSLGNFKKTKEYAAARNIVDGRSLLTGRELKELFPDGRMSGERLFFLTKSLVVIG